MSASLQKRLLVLEVAAEKLALPLEEVAEVMEPVALSPIPKAPPYFLGAMGFHGTVVPVVDLGLLIGLASIGPQAKFAVIHKRQTSLAFAVNAHVTIVSEDDVLEEEPADGLYAKILTLPQGKIPCLSLEKLLEKIEHTL